LPRGKTGLEGALGEHFENGCGFRNALEASGPDLPKREEVAYELAGCVSDQHSAWLRSALQARCKIGRAANDRPLLRDSLPDEIADDHDS
jgi:hypothetical protein